MKTLELTNLTLNVWEKVSIMMMIVVFNVVETAFGNGKILLSHVIKRWFSLYNCLVVPACCFCIVSDN